MRFRFGWRKKDNFDKRDIAEQIEHPPVDSDDVLSPSVSVAEKENTPMTRILFFGDHDEIGNLYTLLLRSKGFEVLHFPEPSTCALVAEDSCNCPREHACADMIIADMDMEGMSGLDLIRLQKDRGCHFLQKNKAVISRGFNGKQQYLANALECKTLIKPFRLLDMLEWVQQCKQRIPEDRKLTPPHELAKTASHLS